MNEKLEEARRVYELAPPVEEQSAYDYLPAWLEPYDQLMAIAMFALLGWFLIRMTRPTAAERGETSA